MSSNVSSQVVIMTIQEREALQNVWFQKGVKRGEFEALATNKTIRRDAANEAFEKAAQHADDNGVYTSGFSIRQLKDSIT